MNLTQHPTAPPLFQVAFTNGDIWIGTEQELRRYHPDWIPYAQIVEPKGPIKEQHAFDYTRQAQPASTHRTGHFAGIHPEDVPYLTGELEGEEPDEPAYPRSHTSIRRYDQLPLSATGNTRYEGRPVLAHAAIPSRRSALTSRSEAPATPAPKRVRRFRLHPLAYLGLGMLLAFTLWVFASFAFSWFATWQDDLHYGRPRTAQYDMVVGHGDSRAHPSHFIVLNLNAQIVIIEIPGGNISKAVIYQGPVLYGPDASLAPITLTFEDVTHDDKLDMLVHFQGGEIIYLNQHGKFVPQH